MNLGVLTVAVTLVTPCLTGCGVLTTNEQCSEIADVLGQAKVALSEPLPVNPPVEKLQARATTYRDVSARLKRLHLDKELDKSRDQLVKHLQTVALHLDHAKDAVVQAAKDTANANAAPLDDPAAPPMPGPSAGTLRAKQRSQLRRYLNAKTEIEATSAKIAETMQRLSGDCR